VLDDADTDSSLQREERQLAGKSLHLADANLLPSAFRGQPMQIGMVPVSDLAARGTGSARPCERIGIQAQQPSGQIQRKRGLAHPARSDKEQRVWRALRGDAALD
jgi:hypothetical protein